MTTPTRLPPLVDDNWRIANGAFWSLPENPIVCTTLSDDINWCFFGMEIREYPCDDSDECYQCWPRCAYCWCTCALDGECDDEECLTNQCWTSTHLVTGPPWFTKAYHDRQQAIDRSPWRPPPTTSPRPPLVPLATDSVLYYPQMLEAWKCRNAREVWASMFFMYPRPKLTWRQCWSPRRTL